MKDATSNPIKQAWAETFETDGQNFYEYFLGWPGKKDAITKVAYFIFFGWLLTPAKNLLKLLTEFLLGSASNMLVFACNAIDFIGNESSLGLAMLFLLGLLIIPFLMLTDVLRFIVSAITSPIKHAKKQSRVDPGFGALSVFISVVAYITLFCFASPIIALIGAKVGLAPLLNLIANSAIAPKIAYPFVWVLGKIAPFIGLSFSAVAATPTLVGAMILTLVSTFVATVNGIRETFSSSKKPKGFSSKNALSQDNASSDESSEDCSQNTSSEDDDFSNESSEDCSQNASSKDDASKKSEGSFSTSSGSRPSRHTCLPFLFQFFKNKTEQHSPSEINEKSPQLGCSQKTEYKK